MNVEYWKLGISIADVITKSAIAVVLGLATYNLNQEGQRSNTEKERFNRETACWGVLKDTMAFVASQNNLQGEQVNAIRALLPESCNTDDPKSAGFSALLLALLPNKTAQMPSSPSGSASAATTIQPSGASPRSQWVAVGFAGTSDFNFTATDGSPLTGAPKAGDLIEARWSVYVRPSAAGWGTTLATLRSGQCFKVASTQSLPAGTLMQIWASGAPAPCN
jgi:hypothetical protein